MAKKYLRVFEGNVIEHWDTPPKDTPIGENGWIEAIEDFPLTEEGKTTLSNDVTYNLEVSPAIITKELIFLNIDERKNYLLEKNDEQYKRFVEILSKSPVLFTSEEILLNKNIAKNNKTKIIAANTHEDLDNLVLEEIELF